MTGVPRDAALGFVGLGNIGQPMARALLRDGWKTTVLDRDEAKAKPCADDGAVVAESLQDLASCDVLAIAVPDDAAVTSVLTGPEGVLDRLASGSVVLVHSTILPETARELAAAATERGVALLDAPVSGGAERALKGSLTLMVGGEAEALEQARPVLDSLAETVLHAGPSGAGCVVKLANQLMMFAALAGAYEAMDLAASYDVSEQAGLDAVAPSTGDSWVARNWGFFDDIVAAYDAGGTPRRERPWSKDLWDVVAAARAADVRLPVAGLLAQHMADRVEAHAAAAQRTEAGR